MNYVFILNVLFKYKVDIFMHSYLKRIRIGGNLCVCERDCMFSSFNLLLPYLIIICVIVIAAADDDDDDVVIAVAPSLYISMCV